MKTVETQPFPDLLRTADVLAVQHDRNELLETLAAHSVAQHARQREEEREAGASQANPITTGSPGMDLTDCFCVCSGRGHHREEDCGAQDGSLEEDGPPERSRLCS